METSVCLSYTKDTISDGFIIYAYGLFSNAVITVEIIASNFRVFSGQ
jgi:hypothetical protein